MQTPLNYLLSATNNGNLNPIIIVILVSFLVAVILGLLIKKAKQPRYYVKECLLTPTELEYLQVIRALLGNDYLVLPQVNLASVIDKKGDSNFRNELFRNIDFGVFNKDFKPLVLIEINDNTHFRKDRIERDKKVASICKKAGIPLVTFWVKDGISVDNISSVLWSAIGKNRVASSKKGRGLWW
ncbi:MAG: DUF2726 domain-containing protein [Clostridia bacterium]|nr:DUF2726 domain-containing protein [Clostridia bacterium]